ncbi:conjugative transfer ATPase, PFL_4706 family protein [Vibrio zhanjiangensis]|uniref:Conjugative transfer ATPase, PFL_4706 family protein n=1 Tax=Vibrio zhanjiangensis TaxID=1046128 RepID=A0ABQ6F239_9VIBR|nr:conjugative transfer ATPase [Vibrio zhanjiangensis]GLT19558.1 conjugative transfer ATPase, PFL_4706 family protein [Vibrio zhanjiangensis]
MLQAIKDFFTEGKAQEGPAIDYQVPASFASKLPWIEVGDKGLVELEDGHSFGCFFDITPMVTEDKSNQTLDSAVAKVANTLNKQCQDEDNPWVIQIFARDVDNLGDIAPALLENARVRDEFAEAVIEQDRRHFELIRRTQGIFSVNARPWRGRHRQVKMAIYRWLDGTPTDEERRQNLAQLKSLRRQLLDPASFHDVGIGITPSSGQSIFDWLSPLFNPSGVGGETPHYRKPRSQNDQDFSERLLRSSVRSDIDNGFWWFDGKESVCTRVMELDAWDSEHFLSGAVFGEVSDTDTPPQSAVFDELPPGTMMAMTLVPQTRQQAQARINQISHAAVGDEIELVEVREDCARFTTHLKTQPLWRGQIAFFLQASSKEEMDEHTNALRATFNRDNLALRFIRNTDQVSPLDSYLRWLPMNYKPQDDSRFWYCGWVWLYDMLALSPLFGRATGTGSMAFHHFNRGGELFGFDPLTDYESNGHLTMFGPSGSGKSASLVGMMLRLLAVHRPRLFIIEAGNSFGLLGDYCQRHGLSVHRISISPKSKGLMAPFADASHLVGQAVPAVPGEHALEAAHLNDNDSPDDEERDILGELEIMARLMITGGEARELQDYRRADAAMVREALFNAAEQCHQQRCQVRPEHVKDALMAIAQEAQRPEARRQRAQLMAESMTLFCEGLEGDIFNQDAEHWPEADVTIIDLKLYAKTGYEAQLATAYISLINRINAIAERDQYTGRHIVTLTDEAHVISTNELLSPYAVKIVKMWRKLNAWFWLATQDIADFPNSARKMLNNAEWWVLLNMSEDELNNLMSFKNLTEEDKRLIRSMTSEKFKYKEGIVFGQDRRLRQRFRIVPPALYLALGETDGPSKKIRQTLMDKHGISELDAALMRADQIEQARAQYQGELW